MIDCLRVGVADEAEPVDLFPLRIAGELRESLRWLTGQGDGEVPRRGGLRTEPGGDFEVNPLAGWQGDDLFSCGG